jgi:nitrite reductase/ring-hydroxylating ferredoxin subunit
MPSGGAYPMDQCFIDRVYEGFEYERSRKEPPADFPVLPLIPGGRYTDPDFLELEQKFLWKKSWLYACHSNELPHKGSYILWNKTGSPILIVRGEDDQVRAFYNTCRHRGGPLVTASSGKVSGGLTCIYHSWSYDLEGNLRGVPDRRDFSDLNLNCLGLVSVRCERLGNWIFINEDPEAEPLLVSLDPIAQQLQQFDPENIRHVESYGFDVECNVKVMLEAFFEVYHLKNIHQDTVNRILQEDLELAPEIQRSMESPGFMGNRLNYQERRIYHWHEELDRRIGVEHIPEQLRVAPRLSGMIERSSSEN